MCYSEDETQFIKFLESFPQCYKKVHVIAENKTGKTILPTERGRNEFKMYALDEICKSCSSFYENGICYTPKTTDAIWYKKINDIFFIFLIEFKGDCLFSNSKKCNLYDTYETIKLKNDAYPNEFDEVLDNLKIIMSKFTDKLLNSLVSKPLETVTISLPLIYDDYYEKNKNKDDVSYIDIKKFLAKSRIVYRVVSYAKENSNQWRSRANAQRCSNENPATCEKYALKYNDKSISASYESSLKTFHKRYEKAGIVFSAGFVDNKSFNNFVKDNFE